MSCPERRHVYGPVPSRRLGRSLGVDVVPFKVCTFDCIYCQLGRTTCKTIERRDFMAVDGAVEEVAAALAAGSRPDFVTISGSGEPTLHARLGELIAKLRQLFRPVAVLTNGSLLSDPAVREELLLADLVIPSLDAAGPATFNWVNRPHPTLDFAAMVDGLVAFRREFRGALWLEVMLLGGITGIRSEVASLASLAAKIHPDRVQLNTVARPPTESFAYPLQASELREFAQYFKPVADVIVERPLAGAREEGHVAPDVVAELLQRRPCTAADIAVALNATPNEVVKVLGSLLKAGTIEVRRGGGTLFYATVERWR